MSLSLSQSSRKQKLNSDPRNTTWANDTSRFGHQQLTKMGWTPGKGLGYSVEGSQEHVKIKFKTDVKGLGHELKEQDQPTGLDVFQKILGKLNGNLEEVEKDQKRKEALSGLYMNFVPGGVLQGTVKHTSEMLKDRKLQEKAIRKQEKEKKKREKQLKKERKNKEKQLKKAKKAIEKLKKEEKDRPKARGIRATRGKYIEMKKKATMDERQLREILMQ